jgi:hypothetical protein
MSFGNIASENENLRVLPTWVGMKGVERRHNSYPNRETQVMSWLAGACYNRLQLFTNPSCQIALIVDQDKYEV